MQPFALDRQTSTFLALIAVVTVVVAVAAPFGSIALASVAAIGIGAVLVKAMLRARRWWPMTAVEGTIALSGLVLLAGGLGVAGYSMVRLGTGDGLHMVIGWPPVDAAKVGSGWRGVSHTDPAIQQRLKDGLRAAGIPFEVKTRDGKEFVRWSNDHDAAAEAVHARARDPMHGTRSVHFPDEKLRADFVAWLKQKGIEHEVVPMQGKDFIRWDEKAGDLVSQFFDSRSADCQPRAARC